MAFWKAIQQPIRRAVDGEFPQFEGWWRESGITGGNRQLGMDSMEEAKPNTPYVLKKNLYKTN